MSAQDDSILLSIKKVLGVHEDDTSFDLDIMMHINTALSTLSQLGVGPAEGYMITNSTATWDEFLGYHLEPLKLNNVKSLVFLKVRLLFDPPTTSFLMVAYKEQIAELEFRVNVEADNWAAPPEQEPA